MVDFERFVLDNGLRVLLHVDKSTPLAAVNIMYNVGARDEHPERTGFAHLFEHLMFEGSANAPDYDDALQIAGGENNAFTNNDITNYYLTIPASNLETALWLESDRMMQLAFSEEKLKIQKNVVTEEFRQSYLNQPYGDVWLLLRPLIYKVHPYQWPTIGKDIGHIKNADMGQVKDFFYRFYRPDNAVLVISGGIDVTKTINLVKKWFGDISAGKQKPEKYPVEPVQKQSRELAVERDVPFDEIYMAFHTGTRLDKSFYVTDLMTDVLSGGSSARFTEVLVKEKKIFTDANAWISGHFDKGFLTLTGKLVKGQTIDTARKSIWEQIDRLVSERVGDEELQKVKNKLEASHTFAEMGILSRSVNLAYYETLGDAHWLNEQTEKYFDISSEEIRQTAEQTFQPHRVSELHYLSQNH